MIIKINRNTANNIIELLYTNLPSEVRSNALNLLYEHRYTTKNIDNKFNNLMMNYHAQLADIIGGFSPKEIGLVKWHISDKILRVYQQNIFEVSFEIYDTVEKEVA